MTSEGTKPFTVSIHWLSITVFTHASNLIPVLLKHLLDISLADPMDWSKHFVESGSRARYFNSLCFGPLEMRLYRLPRSGGNFCSLEIPGEAIETIGQEAIVDYLHRLCEGPEKFHVTRLDVAFDGAPFTPADCHEAWKRGDVRCEADRKSSKWLENAEGHTLYIGSRSSPRFVRIYDRRGPTRVELELKQAWADGLATGIAWMPFEEWRIRAFSYLRQYLDFVDSSAGASISRAPLLPWWGAFVGNVERATERVKRPDAALGTLSRARQQLERMLPSLCVYKQGLGVSLDDLCEQWESRLKAQHLHKIAEIKRCLGESF
ncbi:MAG: replication initiation factor domain-containing protein [Rhodospirillaceae bacterium]